MHVCAPACVWARASESRASLLPGDPPCSAAQVADFGLAAVTAPTEGALSAQCGTPEFTAPEIAGGREYNGEAVRCAGGAARLPRVFGSLRQRAPGLKQGSSRATTGRCLRMRAPPKQRQ